MKAYRRIFSLIVALVMVVGLIPATSATETEGEADGTTYGTAIGVGASAVQDGQYLVYGENQWFVMDNCLTTTGAEGISVISKDIVEKVAFNKGGLDNGWANSYAKTWNEEYAAANFSASELAGILATSKEEASGSYFGANWSKDALNGEKLFFLSAAEVDQYFTDSIQGLIASCDSVATGWWLRSAYTDRDIYGGIISDAGYVGYPHIAAAWGARPAFNVAESSIAISSAAVGGKVSGAVGADALTAVGESSVNQWKLTVIDDAHKAFAATIGDGSGKITLPLGYESWVLPVTYSGAVSGENEYVSVLLCSQTGEALYYGNIAQNSASGTIHVNMPAGLSGKYTVYVFAEQCNGDNATDFSSALVSAEVVVDDGISNVNSWGLILEGDIHAKFLMELSDTVVADESAYVLVEVDGVQNTYPVSELVGNNGFYEVNANVAAAQMTEDILIQVITDETEGSVFRYSVKLYGDYILNNSDSEKDINIVKAMLNYGGKAQDYFEYNTGKKADDGISIVAYDIPYTEGLAAKKSGSSENVKFYGASLVHEHKTGIRFYFTSTDEAILNVTFSTETESDLPVYKNGSFYYVEICDIAPHQLCDEITVSVDGLNVTYSPFYYIHRVFYRDTTKASLRDLMYAMYNYYCYANAYLA